MDISKYVTASEAAEIIGVTNSYIRKLCRSGALPASMMGYGWLIPRSAVKAWADREYTVGRPRSGNRY